jgi:hypothetical protein
MLEEGLTGRTAGRKWILGPKSPARRLTRAEKKDAAFRFAESLSLNRSIFDALARKAATLGDSMGKAT